MFLVNNWAWALRQIRKIERCACAGNAGNVFPATNFKGNRYPVIPACITARASRTCRDACRGRLPCSGGEPVPGISGACAICNFTYLVRGSWIDLQWVAYVHIRQRLHCRGTYSPWANGGPRAPPPWSSVSGTILFRRLSGIILAMLPEKKLGLTTSFGHFSKWPPHNLRFPISRKLLHVESWFGGLNLYFLGQGIR